MFIAELHLKTFEVMFISIFYIIIDFTFIRKLYLLELKLVQVIFVRIFI